MIKPCVKYFCVEEKSRITHRQLLKCPILATVFYNCFKSVCDVKCIALFTQKHYCVLWEMFFLLPFILLFVCVIEGLSRAEGSPGSRRSSGRPSKTSITSHYTCPQRTVQSHTCRVVSKHHLHLLLFVGIAWFQRKTWNCWRHWKNRECFTPPILMNVYASATVISSVNVCCVYLLNRVMLVKKDLKVSEGPKER